jgi:hypothetical protein
MILRSTCRPGSNVQNEGLSVDRVGEILVPSPRLRNQVVLREVIGEMELRSAVSARVLGFGQDAAVFRSDVALGLKTLAI